MPVINDLFYFASGLENILRPPIVLLHGAGGNHLHWPPQVRRMYGQRVYALDLPGHGKSGGTGRQSIQDYASDVIQFLDALRLNAAVIVGHSMGGAIALTLALEYPKRVMALGLVGTGARLRVSPAILESTSSAETFSKAIDLISDLSFGPSAFAGLKDLARRQILSTRHTVLHGDFVACDRFDVMGRLSEIKVPTLILCGTEDRLTPLKYSEYLHHHIPQSQLITYPGAGHMVMLEEAQAVAQALSKFADTIPYSPGFLV